MASAIESDAPHQGARANQVSGVAAIVCERYVPEKVLAGQAFDYSGFARESTRRTEAPP